MPALSPTQLNALLLASTSKDGQGRWADRSYTRATAAPRTLSSLVRQGLLVRTSYFRLTTYTLTEAGAQALREHGYLNR